jgi:hypothetical protein
MNLSIARRFQHPFERGTWSKGVLAGLAGGCAEVVWIYLYSRVAEGQAAAVARGVTHSFLPDLAAPSLSVALGIAIHMGLAVMLGLAVAILVRSLFPELRATAMEPLAVTGLLVAVWAINFLVVLPVINPEFAGLVPYWVSLFSKVLFGIAAVVTLTSLESRD